MPISKYMVHNTPFPHFIKRSLPFSPYRDQYHFLHPFILAGPGTASGCLRFPGAYSAPVFPSAPLVRDQGIEPRRRSYPSMKVTHIWHYRRSRGWSSLTSSRATPLSKPWPVLAATGSCAGWLHMLCGRGFAPRMDQLPGPSPLPTRLCAAYNREPARSLRQRLSVYYCGQHDRFTTNRCLFRHRTFCCCPAAPTNTPRWNARLRRRRGVPVSRAKSRHRPALSLRREQERAPTNWLRAIAHSVPQGWRVLRVLWSGGAAGPESNRAPGRNLALPLSYSGICPTSGAAVTAHRPLWAW